MTSATYNGCLQAFLENNTKSTFQADEYAFVEDMGKSFNKNPFEVMTDIRIHYGLLDLGKYRDAIDDTFTGGKGYYFITLTMKPTDRWQHMFNAMHSILDSKMYKIDKYTCTWELTEVGTPHIHMFIRVTDKTPKKRDLVKFNDGNHVDMKRVPASDSARILQYMKKQDNDPKLINFLRENNLTKYIEKKNGST